ncbi:SAM-dependent methyltransferase [Thermomonospora cellulosilytica]|uniref:SAM-dependent methyltransferase n=1 Tax=Thermomonospora cellulosilytica TaxID=1411118 RepID=A0A7W3MXY2_9ACTN|nr:SAM-dependent methyltransferase [Thermomonospora cellulosilytica]MBA9003978.1 SAM-dependent methyltransferase [Thermomonospora cellulosilytica]
MDDLTGHGRSVHGGRPPAHRASAARVYDYLLDGKDNYQDDRDLADRMLRLQPRLAVAARENRAFVGRAVRWLASAGLRQFLDIGCGLPGHDDVHRIAGRQAPGVRVVYVDRDPIVLAHARALLAGGDEVRVAPGDLTRPRELLADLPLLDLDRPVAVVLSSVLHHLADDDRPREVMAELRDALAPGSALLVSHLAADLAGAGARRAAELFTRETGIPLVPRTRAEIAAFFGDFRLVEPGLVATSQWRSTGPVRPPAQVLMYAGVALSGPGQASG